MTFCWISHLVLVEMESEAERKYPFETGGILLGYITDDADVVVCAQIGPGPRAQHGVWRYHPDHEWQCAEIERIYAESGGQWVYLGDWHTHPKCSPEMSLLDRLTLCRISNHKDAQLTSPIMIIGGGNSRPEWNWVCHQHQHSSFILLSSTQSLVIRCFDMQDIHLARM